MTVIDDQGKDEDCVRRTKGQRRRNETRLNGHCIGEYDRSSRNLFPFIGEWGIFRVIGLAAKQSQKRPGRDGWEIRACIGDGRQIAGLGR
ncbi:MAG: hypothetical protein HC788_14010 [Sphingopyxis sp.]|nr:hypothetical protein [Sphingopyxis sp.]